LDDHVHRVSLPDPGGSPELDDLVADFMARPLDPARPLWEMVVVEGLAGDRTAVVVKLHHAILDGVSGASLLATFLDLGPRGRPVPFPAEPWVPDPVPTSAALLRYAAGELVHQPEVAKDALRQVVDAVVDIAGHNRQLAEKGEVPPPAPFSAPRTSLNGNLSSRRRFASVAVPLEDVKLVRRTFGATVNDVLLAGVAGAVSRLLADRGESPDRSLVALVPVSTRGGSGQPAAVGSGPAAAAVAGSAAEVALGNSISAMLVGLATDIEDPVERLTAIAAGTTVAKAQEGLIGGRLFENLAQMAPPILSSRAIRWAAALRLFDRLPPLYNLVVSTVPGPDFPIWCAGSRVAALTPIGPIAEGAGLNVTAMSYHGTINFGLLGCRRLAAEVDQLAVLLDDSLGELVVAALEQRGAAG
ncbi:MAG TPA: wax ester/triacylglycerol synthase family O-acyltransferase, partial [Acidimicrobiales bacterium]|nr:wax ester/triacylglycerol synthase family O-acyltransferase [Acidimicrobiales bacterium]